MDSLASPHREAAWAGKSTWEPWETVARILPKQEQLWVQPPSFQCECALPSHPKAEQAGVLLPMDHGSYFKNAYSGKK